MSQLKLTIVTPTKKLVEIECEDVTLPTQSGQLKILPDHAPLLSLLGVGRLSFTKEDVAESVFVNEGYLEVCDNKVLVLSETGESVAKIDLKRAKLARERARERLAKKDASDIDIMRAELALRRALSRIEIADNDKKQ